MLLIKFLWNASSISNSIPRKPTQRRLNSLSKTWAFPYTTLTYTSFRFIKNKSCINKTKINSSCHNIMSYKIPHEEKNWLRVISIMRTWPCQNPFQFLAITWSIIIFHTLGPRRAYTWIWCRNMCRSPFKGQHVWWYAISKQRYVGEPTKSGTARKGHKWGMLMYGRENITLQQIKPTINN